MNQDKPTVGVQGIYDATVLGKPRMLVLGIQHLSLIHI